MAYAASSEKRVADICAGISDVPDEALVNGAATPHTTDSSMSTFISYFEKTELSMNHEQNSCVHTS